MTQRKRLLNQIAGEPKRFGVRSEILRTEKNVCVDVNSISLEARSGVFGPAILIGRFLVMRLGFVGSDH